MTDILESPPTQEQSTVSLLPTDERDQVLAAAYERMQIAAPEGYLGKMIFGPIESIIGAIQKNRRRNAEQRQTGRLLEAHDNTIREGLLESEKARMNDYSSIFSSGKLYDFLLKKNQGRTDSENTLFPEKSGRYNLTGVTTVYIDSGIYGRGFARAISAAEYIDRKGRKRYDYQIGDYLGLALEEALHKTPRMFWHGIPIETTDKGTLDIEGYIRYTHAILVKCGYMDYLKEQNPELARALE